MLLAVAMAASAIFLIWETRGTTLAVDDWFIGYGARTGHSLHDFFYPFNGHLIALPVLINKTFLEIWGVKGAFPMRLMALAIHLTTAGLLFVYARRALGPLLALGPAVLFLFLGTANNAFVGATAWPLTVCAATGLGAWLLMERRTFLADAMASFLLMLGVLSDGYVLPFCVAAIAIVLLDRRSARSRLWIPAVPLAIYVIWWLIVGHKEGQLIIASIGGLPAFFFDSLGASLASITGFFTAPGSRSPSFEIPAGQALAAALLGLLLAAILFRRYRPPREALPALIATFCFWLLTGISAEPARLPDSSRYLYISVLLVLLVLAAAVKATRFRWEGAIALSAICVVALLPNVRELNYAGASTREQSDVNRTVFGAADLVESRSPGGINIEEASESEEGNLPDLLFSFDQYYAAKKRFGTPAFSRTQMKSASAVARDAADRVLIRALGIHSEPANDAHGRLQSAGASPVGGEVSQSKNCLSFRPILVGATVILALPPGGLWVHAQAGSPVNLGVRRFGETFVQLTPMLGSSNARIVVPTETAGAQEWQLQVAAAQPVLICGQ